MSSRSVLDIDRMFNEAIEMSIIGMREEAVVLFRKIIEELDERFSGDARNVHIDVLVRRFKALINLSRTYSAIEEWEKALESIREASRLAAGPLRDFPEFFILSCVEMGLLYLISGNQTAAKDIISKASKAPKGENSAYAQAIVAQGTGRLLVSFGRYDVASAAVKSGLVALKATDDWEKVELKARLMAALADACAGAGDVEGASKANEEAIEFLLRESSSARDSGDNLDAVYYLAIARGFLARIGESSESIIRKVDINISLAGLLDIRGYWPTSESLYAEALGLLSENFPGDSRRFILCWNGVGNLYCEQKKYDRAMEVLKKSMKMSGETDDPFCMASSYFHAGLVVSKHGFDNKGIEYFEDALDILGDVPDSKEKHSLTARVNNQLGYIEAKRLNYERAIEYYRHSVELTRNHPRDIALAEAYRMLGEIYSMRQQTMQGERALRMALDIFEKTGASVQVAGVYKSIGANYLGMGDLDKATFFIDESIRLLEKLGLETDLPIPYSSKAKICIMREQYQEAEDLFKKDFEIAKKSENKHSLAYSYYHLGMIRRFLNRTHSAEDVLKRAQELFTEVDDQNMLGHVWMELALCLAERKDVKTATDLCAKAQKIFEEKRYSLELGKLLTVRGIILREAGRRQIAQRCLEDAIRNYEKMDVVSLEFAEAYYEFSIFWRQINEKKNATDCIAHAIDIVEKLGLSRKLTKYVAYLTEFNPEEGAKMRLSRMMDKTAAQKIIRSKEDEESLVVERRNLTLLFTDIRGFTTISESMPLEELTLFLNDFYRNVTKVTMNFRGRINKFIGDEVLAIFNMDGALEDHPAWAVKAAVNPVRTMDETNHIREKQGKTRIGIGVGINTGDVLLGTFGSGLRQDYTAIGDNVNIAARLQAKAKAGEIIISQAVYEEVKDIIIAEDIGEHPLKGKGQPLQLWKVTGMKE